MIEPIFIPGNVPSSKNGKQWTGKLLISSKATRKYIKESEIFWIAGRKKFRAMCSEKPIVLRFLFVRGTKHKFDYVNPLQTIQDLMVKYGWIDDDNADEVIPVPAIFLYNKEKPGVYIWAEQKSEHPNLFKALVLNVNLDEQKAIVL